MPIFPSDPVLNAAAATAGGAPDPFSTTLPTSLAVYREVRSALEDNVAAENGDPDDGGDVYTNEYLRPHLRAALRSLNEYCAMQGIPWTSRTKYVHWGPYARVLWPGQDGGIDDFAVPRFVGYRALNTSALTGISAINMESGPNGQIGVGWAEVIPTGAVPHPFTTGSAITISGLGPQLPTALNDIWIAQNDQSATTQSRFFITGVPARANGNGATPAAYLNAKIHFSASLFVDVDGKDESTIQAWATRTATAAPQGWCWRQGRLELSVTNVRCELAINYYCSAILPTSIYETIGIVGGLSYLLYETAANATRTVSPTVSGKMRDEAESALVRLRNPQVRQQQMIPVLRPAQYAARRHKF